MSDGNWDSPIGCWVLDFEGLFWVGSSALGWEGVGLKGGFRGGIGQVTLPEWGVECGGSWARLQRRVLGCM